MSSGTSVFSVGREWVVGCMVWLRSGKYLDPNSRSKRSVGCFWVASFGKANLSLYSP